MTLKVIPLVVGLFKCNPSNICAVFYQISTDSASRGPSARAELVVVFKVLFISLFLVFGRAVLFDYFGTNRLVDVVHRVPPVALREGHGSR